MAKLAAAISLLGLILVVELATVGITLPLVIVLFIVAVVAVVGVIVLVLLRNFEDPREIIKEAERSSQQYSERAQSDGSLRKITLYQFQTYSWRDRNEKTWHIVGEEQSVARFLPYVLLTMICTPHIRWFSPSGRTTYIGTYRRRQVMRFRGELRRRGAELEIRHEQPLLGKKEISFDPYGGK